MTLPPDFFTRLVEFHSPVVHKAPLFTSRGRAALVAESIRKALQAHHPRLSDSRFVAIEGKGSGCYVTIPRLQHTWNVGNGSAESVAHELAYVIEELSKELALE